MGLLGKKAGAKDNGASEEFVAAAAPSQDALDAAADADGQEAIGTSIMVSYKSGDIQFFGLDMETDVIAFGKQSHLTQIALADVEQVELGILV
ncbi:MAG: hypothetical protein ACRD1X_05165 [Vicinamibacteria bacterium]